MIFWSYLQRTALAGVALTIVVIGFPVAAQEARDPTVAPAEAVSSGPMPRAVEGMSVLVRGEQTFLVVGTRLYRPGDTVGNLRVERITETEVWLHDGNALLKVPRFAGITRKSNTVKPACTASDPVAATAAAIDTAGLRQGHQSARAKKRNKTDMPPAAPAPAAQAVACEDTPS